MPKYWLTFRACRDEQWAQKVETPQEKQACEARAKQPPTSGKVNVYHWMENDDGQHVHTLLTQSEMEDVFEMYKYQIIYDSRCNEWDCSTNFGDFNDDDDNPDTEPDPNPNLDPKTFVPADFETSNASIPSDQVEGASSKMHTDRKSVV